MIMLSYLSVIHLLLSTSISAEDPFCGNKCQGIVVSMNKNCHCDSLCSNPFNDCCGDSEHMRIQNHLSTKAMSCHSISREKSALMIKSCPTDWNGPDTIRNLCFQSASPFQDPFGGTPITNMISSTTYSSFYCAICNNDANSMIFWNLKVICPTMNSDIALESEETLQYIYFNRLKQQWGFSVRSDATGSETFHGCSVKYVPPDTISLKVRYCEPDEIDNCVSNWKQDVIRQMCGTYTDPVYSNGTRYKNFYCAICNHVDQSTLSCGSAVGPRYDGVPDEIESPNFALLMDVNLSDGNKVGKRTTFSSCAEGEVYDPFKKTCRNIVCGIPGFQVKEGKCTRD